MEAVFLKSSVTPSQFPPPTLPEYAFTGRSNVGKSTLINMLLQCRGLAKTSSTPGKTRTINHYLVNRSWYLADLPGYGYARLSKIERKALSNMISSYLQSRKNLLNTFILIDARISPQPIDIDFINIFGEYQLPFCLVFTKTEKLGQMVLQQQIDAFLETLSPFWDEFPKYFITSGKTKVGRDEILDFINDTNLIM
ncbi:MAG: YihA family ribosome biogenesis GTP-binding protein [Bacteroidales bacterium]|nr:YihA family ribosome biogenesis GTP-binding protein [Bacteroidales bacterium]MBP9511145.1 YihA family ribosome biogenesis GTP-binding protein [Bacteroidales bacterium]MBP9588357.1 YihA family ribosome biogenesis GTP-binding protein [Bacteroidales bacterium]